MSFEFKQYDMSNVHEIKDDWRLLHERSVRPSFYNQFYFVYQSLISFSDGDDHPFFITVKYNKKLIAIFFLQYYKKRSSLVNLTVYEFSALDEIDKPYPIIDSEFHSEAWQGFFLYLKNNKKWDMVKLIEQEESALSFISDSVSNFPYIVRLNPDKEGPIIPLDLTWDDFLKDHKKTRKRLSRFEKFTGGDFSFDIKFGNKLLPDYIDVESRSWKKGKLGIKRSASTHDFYQGLLHGLDEEEVIIGILYYQEKAISAELAYINNDTFYLAQGCYDETFSEYSPGMISTAYLLKSFFNHERIKKADGLCGYAGYLNSWANEIVKTKQIDIYNNNFNTAMFFSIRAFMKIASFFIPKKKHD